MIISVGMYSVFIMVLIKVFSSFIEPFIAANVFGIFKTTFFSILGICSFLYFIDFITLGWLKRFRFISKIYFPVYRFFGWITLAFLYRPLYYNLIDNRFGRRIGFLLVPYMLIVASVTTLRVDSFLYFPKRSNDRTLNDNHYQDQLEAEERVKLVIIPSKFVDNDFLEIFVPYTSDDDDVIEHYCPDLRPDKIIGLKTDMVQIRRSGNEISPVDSLLLCAAMVNKIIINDSLFENVDYYFYSQSRYGEKGLMATFDISYLNRGKHTISVDKRRKKENELSWKRIANFPFWKE